MLDLAINAAVFVLSIPVILCAASPFIFLVWAVLDANDNA